MKQFLQMALCAGLIVAGFIAPADSDIAVPGVKTVTVWGETNLTADPVADRERALAQARREAVERVVGAYVTSETLVKNYQVVKDRIYSQAGGFINGYEVLLENREGSHRMKVRAQVSVTPVTEILRRSGLLRQWRVGVLMKPEQAKLSEMLKNYSQSGIRDVSGNIETMIGQKLVQAGFKVKDARFLKTARRQFETSGKVKNPSVKNLDLLVTGAIQLEARASGGPMHQAVCQIYIRVIRVDTGEIVYQGQVGNTFDGVTLIVDQDLAAKYADTLGNGFLDDGTPDLRVFGGGAPAALNKALRLSSEMTAELMMTQISRLPAAVSSRIALEIHGLNFSELTRVEDLLISLQGVADVIPEGFSGGVQNMEVEYDGTARTLARRLSRSKLFKSKGLKVTHLSKGKIVLKAR